MAANPIISGVPRGLDRRGLVGRLFTCDAPMTMVAIVVGAVVVMFIGLPLAVALNIWIDEAFTLHTTGGGLTYAAAQSIAFEAQPPLYFILEAGWRLVNEGSIAFARFPSIAFAAGAVAVIVVTTRRVAPSIPPLAVALLTACNPLIIWAAVEMRVYALVILIAALLTWALFDGFVLTNVTQASRQRVQIFYGAFAIAGLYTQYYFGFLLIAHALTVLILRRGASKAYVMVMAVVGIAFAPFLRIALVHVHASGDFVGRTTPLNALHEVMNTLFVFVLPHDLNWSGPAKYIGFLVAATLVVVLTVFGRPTVATEPERTVYMHWLISTAIFTLLFSFSGIPIDPLRHLVILAPISLLAAFCFAASPTRRRVLLTGIAGALCAAFTLTSLAAQYRPPVRKLGDWKRVAATVFADDRSTPVAIFPAEAALPLRRYSPVEPIAVPRPMPFAIDYVRATTLTGESEVAAVLDPLRTQSARLWMVTTGPCGRSSLNGYNYNCRYLEEYLAHRYHLARTVPFYGALVRLYETLPAAGKERR